MENSDDISIDIRFSWKHDPDLAALCRIRGFSMPKAILGALRACVRGTEYVVRTPNIVPEPSPAADARTSLIIRGNTDADVIRFLKGVKPRYRSSLIKALVRRCLERIPVEVFLTDPGSAPRPAENASLDGPAPQPPDAVSQVRDGANERSHRSTRTPKEDTGAAADDGPDKDAAAQARPSVKDTHSTPPHGLNDYPEPPDVEAGAPKAAQDDSADAPGDAFDMWDMFDKMN